MNVRPTRRQDIPALQSVLNETGLFPADMLPGLVSNFLTSEDSADLWMSCEVNGTAMGFCYAVPEQLADGTWNMLAIAVHPESQGGGLGAALVRSLETALRARGQRILLADTSGTDEFSLTRSFYRKNGYVEEARIRDFWAPGDDKVVFWKRMD
jgi:ribosomal protein S18 acetylase RimI-like enzyme